MYPEMTIGGRAHIPEHLLQLGVRARIVEEMGRKISELTELKAKQAGLVRIKRMVQPQAGRHVRALTANVLSLLYKDNMP